ncbi:hypothetical protein EXIGLDRAFT_841104, partial [Exidia glandulosa HHB12029]
ALFPSRPASLAHFPPPHSPTPAPTESSCCSCRRRIAALRTDRDVSAVAPARTDLCTGTIGLEARTDLCTSGPFGAARSSVAVAVAGDSYHAICSSVDDLCLALPLIPLVDFRCTPCDHWPFVSKLAPPPPATFTRAGFALPSGERKSRRDVPVDIIESLPEVTGTDQERRTVAFRASRRTIGVESHALAIASGFLFAADLQHLDVTDTVRLFNDLPFEVLVASISDIELTIRPIHVVSSASTPLACDIYHAEHVPLRI